MKPRYALLVLTLAYPAWADDFGSMEALGSDLKSFRARPRAITPNAALPAPIPAAYTNHSGQFPTKGTDQSNIGSCHSFAALAVLEAALFRRYKTHEKLSEADLFIRAKLMTDGYYRLAYSKKSRSLIPQEGGFVDSNLRYMLERGVTTDASMSYSDFLRYYNGKEEVKDGQYKYTPGFKGKVVTQSYNDGMAPGMTEGMGPGRSELNEAIAAKVRETSIQTLTEDIAARFPSAAADRARILEMTRGFKIYHKQFAPVYSREGIQKIFPGLYAGAADAPVYASELSKHHCVMFGEGQGEILKAHLDAGRPVAIGFELTGLPDWDASAGAQGGDHGFHAVVVDGYHGKDGALVFTTRNSWGSSDRNHPLPADALCRINALTTVLAPGDPPTPLSAEKPYWAKPL